jgi:hypothetical protein
MKNIFSGIALFVITACCLHASVLRSTDGRFSAEMPGTPKITHQQYSTSSGTYMTTSYQVLTDDASFTLDYTDYSFPINNWTAEDWAARTVAAVPGAQMLSLSRARGANRPGGHVEWEAANMVGLFWATMVGNRLYQIGLVGPDGPELQQQAEDFLKSFQIGGPALSQRSSKPQTVAKNLTPAAAPHSHSISGWLKKPLGRVAGFVTSVKP